MGRPNIVKVLDEGTTDSGRPYFCDGAGRPVYRLSFCDEEKLTTAAPIDLFFGICSAIEHAFPKGIIHRDLNRSNLILSLHDKPVPNLID